MDEITAVTAMVLSLIAAITFLFAYDRYQQVQTDREAIKAGLVEKHAPGRGRIWSKP